VTGFNREAVATRIALKLYGDDPVNYDPDHYGRIRENLLGYSEGMLTLLQGSIGVSGGPLDLIGFLIYDEEEEPAIREALYFLEQCASTNSYPAVLCNLIQGLHQTDALPDCEDYSQADDLTRRQCIALINVLLCLMQTGVWVNGSDPQKHRVIGKRFSSFISNEELVRLIMDRPDDYPRIVQAIRQRKNATPAVIAEVLDSPAPSLSDGAL
jgi:hypothetical protein